MLPQTVENVSAAAKMFPTATSAPSGIATSSLATASYRLRTSVRLPLYAPLAFGAAAARPLSLREECRPRFSDLHLAVVLHGVTAIGEGPKKSTVDGTRGGRPEPTDPIERFDLVWLERTVHFGCS